MDAIRKAHHDIQEAIRRADKQVHNPKVRSRVRWRAFRKWCDLKRCYPVDDSDSEKRAENQ